MAIATTTLLAVAAIGTSIASYMGQQEAAGQAREAEARRAQAQKESQAAQSRQAEVESQRARIQQVREARIRKAQILASTGGLGQGTSGIGGSISSISSQQGSNIGFINQTQTFAQQATDANQRAADETSNIFTANQKIQQWQQINSMFGASSGSFTTIFGGNKIPGVQPAAPIIERSR